jgi:hypothetical protein
MRLLAGFTLSLFLSATVAAAEPDVADIPGEAEKAAAIAELEAEIEAATERKAKAAKDGDRERVKRLIADLKSLRLQLSKVKAKTPEECLEEVAEKKRKEALAEVKAKEQQEKRRG